MKRTVAALMVVIMALLPICSFAVTQEEYNCNRINSCLMAYQHFTEEIFHCHSPTLIKNSANIQD